jgi:hypothetical protein
VFQKEDLGRGRGADLHVIYNPVFVHLSGEWWIGQDHIKAVQRKLVLRFPDAIERIGEDVPAVNADVGETTKGQVHGRKADHPHFHVATEKVSF